MNSSSQQVEFLWSVAKGIIMWLTLSVVILILPSSKRLDKKANIDIKTRIVSIIHGLITFLMPLALYLRFFSTISYGDANPESINTFLWITASYMVVDLSVCQYYGLTDGKLYLHHIVMFCGTMEAGLQNRMGILAVEAYILGESPNLPLHLRIILDTFGLKYTQVYEWVETAYYSIYLINRSFFGIFLTVKIDSSESVSLSLKAVSTTMMVFNLYFGFFILQNFRKKVKRAL